MNINWNHIEKVFFDMDGTLLDLHYDNHFWEQHLPKRYAEIQGLSIEIANDILKRRIHSLQGKIEWYCIDFWSDTLNLDIMTLKYETAHRIQWRPYAEKLLKRLKARGISLYLVTNAHPKSIAIKHQHQPLTHYFDDIISSHDYQAAKESTLFWSTLKERLEYSPAKTLFFDDNIAVLTSAKENGQLTNLFDIAKPDSQRPKRQRSLFPMIECFSTILPDKLGFI